MGKYEAVGKLELKEVDLVNGKRATIAVLRRDFTQEVLGTLNGSGDEAIKKRAAARLSDSAFHLDLSRQPRGTNEFSAPAGMEADHLQQFYELVLHEGGEIQEILLLTMAHAADKQFVPIARQLLTRNLSGNNRIFVINALGHIAGKDALNLLKEISNQYPDDAYVRSTIYDIENGAMDDLVEGARGYNYPPQPPEELLH